MTNLPYKMCYYEKKLDIQFDFGNSKLIFSCSRLKLKKMQKRLDHLLEKKGYFCNDLEIRTLNIYGILSVL